MSPDVPDSQRAGRGPDADPEAGALDGVRVESGVDVDVRGGDAPSPDLVGQAAAAERTTSVPAAAPAVDPEDWAGSGADDERYLRDRPPHWE